jgi:peptide/nickel transport system permease protein
MKSQKSKLGENKKWQRLKRNKMAIAGLLIICAILLIAILAPYISPYDPLVLNIRSRFQSPNSEFLFGTDNYGRDLFSRVLYGARVSLKVGVIVVFITSALGTFFGLIAGYFRKLDYVIMRVMDAFMSFPTILLGISIVAILSPSEMNAAIALSVVYTPRTTRIVRSAVLEIKGSEFVRAAKSLGASDFRIILKHILPNCLTPLIVQSTFVFAYAVLAEASLSFVGAGPPPPAPSWGNILSEGRQYIRTAPWITIFPGIFIALTVLGLNLTGDGLRDALDPKMKK